MFSNKCVNKIHYKKNRDDLINTINLSALTRPDLLFSTMIAVTSRLEYGDPFKYHVKFEVVLYTFFVISILLKLLFLKLNSYLF